MSNTQQLKVAKQKLKELGITVNYNSEWEEYRVNFINGKESTASYTNDIEDALNTGIAMAKYYNELQGATK